MQMTHHIAQRMSQRGITKNLVELVFAHGELDGDKATLDRKAAKKLLEQLQHQEKLLKKVIDKGGMVVVAEGDYLITAYNIIAQKH